MILLRLGVILVAVCAACAGCSKATPDSKTKTEDRVVSKQDKNLELKFDWTSEGRCVSLFSGGDCLKTMHEVRSAAPELHKLHENPRNLAYIAHALHPGISDELFRTRGEYQAWWTKWFEPDGFFSRNFAFTMTRPSGVDPEEIKDAVLIDGVLTYYSGRVISIDFGVQVFVNRVDFGSDDWTPRTEELTTSHQPRQSIDERTKEIFGGLIEGFVHASAEGGSLYLAAKPQADAFPFVWKPDAEPAQRFKTWESLVEKFPQAASPSIASELADGINHYPQRSGLRLIRDVQAYKTEYREGKWDVLKLRYWGDELRVTRFNVTKWEEVVAPFIQNGILIAHFRDNDRQPARLTYPLAQFALQPELEFESLSTSELVSDSRLGPTDFDVQPRPTLVQPDGE